MRHLKHRHQLGRKKEHRIAMMANLSASLIRHGRIKTTLPKAKALRPFVEKVITLARKAEKATPERALHFQRLAVARVRDRDAVRILFREKAGEFTDRAGGYTRIYKLGTRVGDAAEMAVIQLIPGEDTGYEKKGRKKSASKKTASKKAAKKSAEAADKEESPAPPAEDSESAESNAEEEQKD